MSFRTIYIVCIAAYFCSICIFVYNVFVYLCLLLATTLVVPITIGIISACVFRNHVFSVLNE